MSLYTLDIRVPLKEVERVMPAFEKGRSAEFDIVSSELRYSDLQVVHYRIEIYAPEQTKESIQKKVQSYSPDIECKVHEDLSLYEKSLIDMAPRTGLEFHKSFLATSPEAVEIAQKYLLPQRSSLKELKLTANRVGLISDGGSLEKPYQILFQLERDVYLISRHTRLQAFPLLLETINDEHLIKTIQSLAPNFFALRLSGLDRSYALDVTERLNDVIEKPLIHCEYDETSTVIAATLANAARSHGIELKQKVAAIIGLDPVGHGLAEILFALGLSRIYGIDPDARQLTRFEKSGGIASSLEHVYEQCDFIIITPHITVRLDEQRFHPDQIILSFAPNALRIKNFSDKHLPRVYQGFAPHPVFILPGMIAALHKYGINKVTIDMKLKLFQSLLEDESLVSFLPKPSAQLLNKQLKLFA